MSPAEVLDRAKLSDRALVCEIARKHGMETAAIRGFSQLPKVLAARREAAIVLRERGLSFPRIGFLIARHHASVINLIRGRAPIGKPGVRRGA
jgi:hypothetical protein